MNVFARIQLQLYLFEMLNRDDENGGAFLVWLGRQGIANGLHGRIHLFLFHAQQHGHHAAAHEPARGCNACHAEAVGGEGPVSYTHLDVYKRQVCE